jgi:hypothetical protein
MHSFFFYFVYVSVFNFFFRTWSHACTRFVRILCFLSVESKQVYVLLWACTQRRCIRELMKSNRTSRQQDGLPLRRDATIEVGGICIQTGSLANRWSVA